MSLLSVEIDSDVSVFYDVRQLGVLTAPATTAITVTKPDGTTISASAPSATIATGQYRYDFTCDQVGEYIFRLKTTGPRRSKSDVIHVTPAEHA